MHGIALAVRAGASSRVYFSAVSAVAAIGAGAFAVSFIALRDLMLAIGYTSATVGAFPAIIDTAVAVSTLMLVGLGDKPARRSRSVTTPASTQDAPMQQTVQGAKADVMAVRAAHGACTTGASRTGEGSARVQLRAAQIVRSTRAEGAEDDADLAADLIASGVTTQSVDTVVGVLSAHRDGAIRDQLQDRAGDRGGGSRASA